MKEIRKNIYVCDLPSRVFEHTYAHYSSLAVNERTNDKLELWFVDVYRPGEAGATTGATADQGPRRKKVKRVCVWADSSQHAKPNPETVLESVLPLVDDDPELAFVLIHVEPVNDRQREPA
jgi:hypothetical protein